ncbi:MAG: cytochrome-c peroxidase, partial [Blastocatellia bacterium]
MTGKSTKLTLLIASLFLAILLTRMGGSQAAVLSERVTASPLPPIPLGLPVDTWRYWIPADNPLTPEKIALGRRLFFDPSLSADGTISCASCHKPELGFADGLPVAEGIGGRRGTRNSMSLLNVIYNTAQFWDGRVDTLEEQALEPLI